MTYNFIIKFGVLMLVTLALIIYLFWLGYKEKKGEPSDFEKYGYLRGI